MKANFAHQKGNSSRQQVKPEVRYQMSEVRVKADL
jgi:hypothetical protein